MTRHLLILILLPLLSAQAFSGIALIDTISGTVSGTLTAAQSPYIVTGNLLVPDGSTLTIEPGVEVRFTNLYSLQVAGVLIAQGTSGNRILFTSDKGSPAPGDWSHIYFTQNDTDSVVDYCDFWYGGGGGAILSTLNMWFSNPSVTNSTIQNGLKQGIHLAESAPTLTNLTISQNGGIGIDAVDANSTPSIANCTIQNNGDYAISMLARGITNISSVTITGNAKNSIRIEEDNVNTGTWFNHNVPYVVNGSVTINDGEILTIADGNELRFTGLYAIQVNGALVAQGTPSSRIVFTSNKTSPARGDWAQIFFSNSDSLTKLDYCDILYGGGGGATVAVLNFLNSSPPISNCVVQNSLSQGMRLVQSSPAITNTSLTLNAGIAIDATDAGSLPLITNCTISSNDDYAMAMLGRNVPNIASVSLSENGKEGILVRSDNVNTGTWRNHNAPYVMAGSITVNDGQTLTINPGNELRFTGLYSLAVNGALVARGDSLNRITFTSNKAIPAPGDWNQISFSQSDSGTILDYCDVLYGGSSTAAVNLSLSDFLIANSTVRYSLMRGIYLSQSSPTIRGTRVSDNTGNGVHILSGRPDLGTNANPGNNSFRDNGGWEVLNNTGDTIYAMHNYWVANDSATIDTAHIWDNDENASKGPVLFSPWLANWPTDVVREDRNNIPSTLSLEQNFPNPFNPVTTIRFALPEKSFVRLTIHDLLGKTVATLVDGVTRAGMHEVRWEASRVSTGVYVSRLQTNQGTRARKLLLIR